MPKRPKRGQKQRVAFTTKLTCNFYKLFIQLRLFDGIAGKSVSRGEGGWGVPRKVVQKGEQTENLILGAGGVSFSLKRLIPVRPAGDAAEFSVAGSWKWSAIELGWLS